MEISLVDSVDTMETLTTQKIEETVKEILSEADMDQMTEFKLRIAASAKLGFDLTETNHKKLVRDVLEAYLLSTLNDEANHGEATVPDTVAPAKKETEAPTASDSAGAESQRIICKLSEKRNATVGRYRNQAYLSIGESSQGKPFRGVHLSTKQWFLIKNNFNAIENCIKQCQSKLSSQKEDTSEATDNGQTCGFSIIETSRFDGRNYHYWATQMELFLNQLNLSYVLSEPYADTASKNWLKDDYLCHNHLLNSLSDHLYQKYSKKFKHAKELWEELKWFHQLKESNSKMAQVRNYIEFEILEERSVLKQVEDLNKIAESIVSSGMILDETFHVSTIISKLPPSWRGFCNRLIEEEFVPVWMLMEKVKAEEEVIGGQGVIYRPGTCSENMERRPSLGVNQTGLVPNQPKPGVWVPNLKSDIETTHRGSRSIGWKRKEPERERRDIVVCDNCGRKGHVTKNCWGKFSDERASKKPNLVSSSAIADVVSETHVRTNNVEE